MNFYPISSDIEAFYFQANKSVSDEKKREEDQLIAWFTVRFKKLYTGNDSIEVSRLVRF